jgi:hypothetical protein
MPHYKILGFRSSDQNLEMIIEMNMLQQNDVTKIVKWNYTYIGIFHFKYIGFSRKLMIYVAYLKVDF